MADERIIEARRTPVQSAITELMNHFEFAAFAEGVGPEEVQRICNRVLFGHPDGSAAWEEGGPQGYRPASARGADAVLKELAARDGLTQLDLAAIRRVRHLLFGGDPDEGT